MNDELDERYEVELPAKSQVKLYVPLHKSEVGMRLSELLEITKGIDPDKILIYPSFEVPDWTWLEIHVIED